MTRSEELFEASKKLIPGGVNSPVRAFKGLNRAPLFINRAVGSKIYDVDGREYIDYVSSYGPMILGHGRAEVVDAVRNALDDGFSYGAPTEKEYILAKMITDLMPSMDLIRFVNSGTEAVMSAIRLARGFTNRDLILKFRGCYHGHSDGMLVKSGSAALTQGVSDSLGVISDYAKNTLVAEFNDKESVEAIFKKYGNKIAAVITEPVPANMGVILPKDNFLGFLREICDKYESLLIFDEVITGFRLSIEGAQGLYGVKPDLTTLGKIIGGGMPIGAFGGRRDIMEMISPLGGVYQAGTLSGNPIATTSGIATLNLIKNNTDIYEKMKKNVLILEKSIKEHFNSEVCINRAESLFSIFFTNKEVNNYEDAISSDVNKFSKFFLHMLDGEIYMAPSQFEAVFLSDAHSDLDIKKTIERVLEFDTISLQ